MEQPPPPAPVVAQSLPSVVSPVVAQRAPSFRATSRLRGPSGCVSPRVTLSVRGDEIQRVTFFLDGKKVGTRTARAAARTFRVSVSTSGLRAGVHRVRARVNFSRRSGRRARDHRMSFQRCQAPPSPRFTG